ncbi:hypothetical protein [Candidatus Ichthyocystis hellenicum]|nr:hypothetical protein [Candidatus Ichthyocystis hellenicum]
MIDFNYLLSKYMDGIRALIVGMITYTGGDCAYSVYFAGIKYEVFDRGFS